VPKADIFGLASRATETGSQHGNGGSCKRNGLWRSAPSGYNQKMTSQNVHANAKRLVKALIDRANLDALMVGLIRWRANGIKGERNRSRD
jgi:hypothetical protein